MKKLEADDPETRSADSVAENVEQLKSLFPEAFSEGKIDFEVLKQLLGGAVEEREEKYGLNWHGKRRARQLALTPSTGTLRPCPEESVDWETTKNLFIEGDNLEVLKLLQKSYAGKVKLIYIDPPYNTGKDFVYKDDYRDNIKNYLELTGQTEGGKKLTTNPESSGRFHTDWLNMMYPRLRAARDLLHRAGVVFMSIDEKELHHLRALANDVFGEERFVAAISVVTNMKGRNDMKHIASCHEYLLVYASDEFVSRGLPLTAEQRAAFRHLDESGRPFALRDLRKRGGPDLREDRPKMFFPIYWDEDSGRCSLERLLPTDTEILPRRGDGKDGRWRWGRDRVFGHLTWLQAKRSEKNGRLDVSHRVYLDPAITIGMGEFEDAIDEDDVDDGDEALDRASKPKSVWLGGEFSSDSGKRALKALLPGDVFEFPKSLDLLRTCVLLATSNTDLAMDFTAGSGTFGHALIAQNAIDGQARRFILVQLPEPLDAEKKSGAAAIRLCDELGVARNLAEVTKERLRRAAAAIAKENPLFGGDCGFRVFKLDSSNVREWEGGRNRLADEIQDSIVNLKADRSEADILYEVLLKLGLDLCVPIEKREFASKDVHSVGGGVLFACLATEIRRVDVEEIGLGIVGWVQDLKPAGDVTCVFRDSAFEDDVAKTNLAAILEQHGVQKVRSL